ncbi:MAG TPA: hypothetical protein VFK08_04765 [Rhodanobacteraceae bacterium]|jgi:hypothetical protein|nr:hypothetical protein [Rhodanobacteraceae bacterium]
MKRLSLLLTVLCAAGLPLTAAALDYGPSERMLAAETSAPSLPGAHNDENPFSELVAPHRAHADDDDSASSSSGNGNNDPKPAAPTARRGNAPTPGPATAAPRKHGVLSWQSLLPGSIQ